YMSPEQARSAKHVGSATDVWSLGVALYESLSGRRPWEKCVTVGDLIVAICTENVPPLQDSAPWIDPALAAIVHRAMQRDPAARFATMEAFAEALQPFAGASGKLMISSLRPLRASLKAIVAPRGIAGGTTVPISSAAPTKPSQQPPPPAPRARWIAPAAFAGIVVAIGVGAVAIASVRAPRRVKSSDQATNTVAVATPLDPTPSAAPSKVFHIKVHITPPDAKVTVDGKSAESFEGGVLELHGEPGDRFSVVASVGDKSQRRDVLIDKNGTGSVDSIEVTTAVAKPIGGGAVGGLGGHPGKPIAKPSTDAPPIAKPSAAPESKPPPPVGPTKPVGESSF
ncbi:MAG: serine/threonine protein kinase, partial [Polyangiales bacterium]